MKKFYLNIFFLILIGINFNLISQSKIDSGNQYMIGGINFSLTEWVVIVHSNGIGNNSSFNKELTIIPNPEPATMFLFGSGLIGLAGFGRRKFKKS